MNGATGFGPPTGCSAAFAAAGWTAWAVARRTRAREARSEGERSVEAFRGGASNGPCV